MSQTSEPTFDAFISYSRKDTAFALALQRALQGYAPPFERVGTPRGRLAVFLDQSDLAGTDYFEAIQRSLGCARKLIVVCSPDAAASQFVNDEIQRFVLLHGAANVVPVLWRGLPNNEAEGRPESRAFPPALAAALQMPLALDYRRLDVAREKPDAAEHHSAWIGLLANLLDRPRAEIEQREARRRRARLRVVAGSVTAAVAVLASLTVWALVEGERALAGRLAAQAALPGGLDARAVERRALYARESVARLARLGEPTLAGQTPLRQALAQTPRRLLMLPAGQRQWSFMPDGEHLVVAEAGRLRVLALDGGALRKDVAFPAHARELHAAGLEHLAALDDTGRVWQWGWPGLDAVAAQPPEVSASALACMAADPASGTLVALRLPTGPARHAELLRWRVGQATLVESAQVALASRALSVQAGERCLAVRRGAALAQLAETNADGSIASRLALHWKLQDLAWSIFPQRSAAIELHPDAALAAIGANGEAIAIAADGTRARPAAMIGGRQVPPGRIALLPRHSVAQALSDDGQWLLSARGVHDPYVPLLKATHFEVVSTADGTSSQDIADQAGAGWFTPDAQRVATLSGRRVRLWDRRSGAELLRLEAAGPTAALRFDAASRHAAAVLADGRVEIFALGAVEEGAGRPAGVAAVVLGDSLALASAVGKRLLVHPAATGAPGSGLPALLEIDRHIDTLTASPDGRWLVLATLAEKPLIRLGPAANASPWLVQAGPAPAVRLRGPVARAWHFDVASSLLAMLDAAGTLSVISLSAPQRVAWQADAARGKGALLALAADGSVLALGGPAGLRVYAARDGTLLREDTEPVSRIALSADGRLLARQGQGTRLRVERVGDGGLISEPQAGAVTDLRDLVFSPRGAALLGVGGTTFGTFVGTSHFVEEHLVVWDVASGRLLQRIPGRAPPPGGQMPQYQDSIGPRADEYQQLSNVVWSRERREAAANVLPSVLAYWTLPEERVTSELVVWRLGERGLDESYRAVNADKLTPKAMASGASVLTLAAPDGEQRWLDTSGRSLLEHTCRWIGRNFSADERAVALGSLRQPFACPR